VFPVALPLTLTVQYVRLLGPKGIEVGEQVTPTVGVALLTVNAVEALAVLLLLSPLYTTETV
jgi:hypothetical protein